jgi:5-methylcytosine-specific restriction endonuclease McrA
MKNRLKSCEVCGSVILKERNRNWNEYAKKRFCSHKCCGIAQSQKVIVYCENCGKELQRSPSHARGRIYCSRRCRTLANTVLCTCEICGKEFRRPQSQMVNRRLNEEYNHTYCSVTCQGMAIRKNNGQTQGRRSPEDLSWKQAVLEKDDYTCQICGTDRNLEAHHIKPIQDYPELRHNIANGQCLCHDCHYYSVHNGMPNFIHGRYSKPR